MDARLLIPHIRRRTLLVVALIAVLLVPLALLVAAQPGTSPAVQWLFFSVRVALALVLLAVWALLNVPPRKPVAGRVVLGVARFGDATAASVQPPRRSLLQRLRPRPTWEPMLSEEGEIVLPLPDGGDETSDLLHHTLAQLIAPVPDVALVRLPFIASEQQAVDAGEAANADLVLWGTTERPADGSLTWTPYVTLTRRLEPQIAQSDLRLCGLDTLALPQQLAVWRDRYVGLQQLRSFLLGLIFYAYAAADEALNELAAVRATPNPSDQISPVIAAARLLRGNIYTAHEQWDMALAEYRAAADHPTFADRARVNSGVVSALRGETVAALDQLVQAVDHAPQLALAHHNVGVIQQRVDRRQEAEAHFARAVELDGSLSESYRGLATLARLRGDGDAALAMLQHARTAQPSDVDVRRDLAALLIDRGALVEAQTQLEAALRLDPQHATTYYLLGRLREQAGDAAGAVQALERAVALQPNYAEAYAALGRLYKSTDADQMIDRLAPSTIVTADARAHLELGRVYLQQFRDAEAEHEFRAALAKEPSYAPAHLQLGRVLRRSGRNGEALNALKAALEIDAHELATYHELAELRAEQGELERAAQTLEQASRIAPADAQTAYLLGNVRATQARESQSRALLDQAMAAYERATALDPQHAAAHYNLAVAALTDGDVARAVEALHHAIAINAGDGEAHRLLATILNDLRRPREALQHIARAAELLPGHVPTLLHLSQMQRQADQIDAALATLRQAQKAEPHNGRVLRDLGGLYVIAKQFDRAIATYSRLRDAVPDQADSYLGLGMAYKAAGRLAEALETLQTARKHAPRDTAILTQLAEAYMGLGQPQRAVDMLQQAVAAKRDDPQLFYKLGQMYNALGQPDRANEAYRMYAEVRAAA